MKRERVNDSGVLGVLPLFAVLLILGIQFVVGQGALSPQPDSIPRAVPQPLPNHPGNVFYEGEEVHVRIPSGLPEGGLRWRVLDIDGRSVLEGERIPVAGRAGQGVSLGKPGIGYYRMEFIGTDEKQVGWTSAAVLGRLRAPVPEDSPVCVDAAISWFSGGDPIVEREFASLASLAGVSWVRDRMRWREMQPGEETFAGRTSYDEAAAIQHRMGLGILQVFHDTPPWARDGGTSGEFTRDLRHVYGFCKTMAQRFKGRVGAWEPWNEANVKTFGGHTVDEMCSWQKAAWLGFKEGDPGVIVGWNATAAAPTSQHTDGVLANETWPYFDTYNIHTYDWAHSYLDLWATAREAACGRPLWITESDRGLKHLNNAPWYDLSPRDERLKAEFMAQSFAQSLYAGSSRHFHFILGQYQEPNGVQFGLLRRDRTPRPAYVALAAVGRFLAGARCLGRWNTAPDVHVVAFEAKPGGADRDVLVAWAEKDVDWSARGSFAAAWSPPETLACEAVYDYLGRSLGREIPDHLQSAPIFLVLQKGEAKRLPLERPSSAPIRSGKPSTVVLQVVMPSSARVRVEDKPWSEGYAYRFAFGEEREISLVAYNFGERSFKGRVTLADLPDGWTVTPRRWDVELNPGARKTLPMRFRAERPQGKDVVRDGWIRIRGEFDREAGAVVAFRMVAE